MYKALFWVAIVFWFILVTCIFKSGGAFVPRVEQLESARISNEERIDEISQQIEIIRNQLAQLKPDVKEGYNPRMPAVLRPQQESTR